MKTKQILVLLFAQLTAVVLSGEALGGDDLQGRFSKVVGPFLVEHCLDCHSGEEPEAKLDLAGFGSASDVAKGFATWQHVAERLKAGEMPPEDAGSQPTAEARQAVIKWSKALRDHEAQRNAGDPGPVLARRFRAAEYNYTIRDLTGVDIKPASQFPVDPANKAGFDNTGESLAMTLGLLAKFLDAARVVSNYLLLKPDGLDFSPHPVIVDPDRDKYCVRRIIDFYERQNTEQGPNAPLPPWPPGDDGAESNCLSVAGMAAQHRANAFAAAFRPLHEFLPAAAELDERPQR